MKPASTAFPSGGRGPLVAVGHFALWLSRWRIEGNLPRIPRYVLIVAPHTSNADFFVGLAAKFALGLQAKWLGKRSLFIGPVGWMLRALGGIPVDRSHPAGIIDGVVASMQAAPTFALAVTPEGTRRYSARWKTGFYRVAVAAGVPVVPVAFDWSSRTIAILPPFRTTGDSAGDIRALRRLYSRRMARKPEAFADLHDDPSTGDGHDD